MVDSPMPLQVATQGPQPGLRGVLPAAGALICRFSRFRQAGLIAAAAGSSVRAGPTLAASRRQLQLALARAWAGECWAVPSCAGRASA